MNECEIGFQLKDYFYYSSKTNMKVKLTVGLTTCYKSSITKINQMIYSLFNSQMTCNRFTNWDECLKLKKMCSDDYLNNVDFIELNEQVELIVVIDGTNEIILKNIKFALKNLACKYKNMLKWKIFHCDVANGVSSARNQIIQSATGQYLKFCDDDDLSVNFNQLLSKCEKNVDYIECLMMNLTKNVNDPIYTGWFPSNVIVKTSWIKNNNLLFVDKIVGEDSVWRFDLYQKLKSEGKTRMIHEPIYLIFCKSFKTTNNDDINNVKGMIERVFRHEKIVFGKIPMNPLLFQILSIIIYKYDLQMMVSDYVLNHVDEFEFSKELKELKRLKKQLITNQEIKYKRQISELRTKYYKDYEKIGGKVDYELFEKYYMLLYRAQKNRYHPLNALLKTFNDKFNTEYNFRLYVHMSKRNNTHVAVSSGDNIRFHDWLNGNMCELREEKYEYNFNNDINDPITLKDIKYSFVPAGIFTWCLLNASSMNKIIVNDEIKISKYVELKINKINHKTIIIFILIMILLMMTMSRL